MYQHPSDWHNDTGIIRQAEEQEMGIILMRPVTSRVFQRLMAEAFPTQVPGTCSVNIDLERAPGAHLCRCKRKTSAWHLSFPAWTWLDVSVKGNVRILTPYLFLDMHDSLAFSSICRKFPKSVQCTMCWSASVNHKRTYGIRYQQS